MAEVKWFENQVIAEVAKVKRTALRKIGASIVKDAKRLCPVGAEIRSGKQIWQEREPGTLRASIRYILIKKGTTIQVIAGSKKSLKSKVPKQYIGRDPFYAKFVEFGTSRTSAQPFLRPALILNQPKILAAFKDILK